MIGLARVRSRRPPSRGLRPGAEGLDPRVLLTGLAPSPPPALRPAPAPVDTTESIPLTDLVGMTYLRQPGGLYGDGRNDPPAAWLEAAAGELGGIVPRDRLGRPDPGGRVGLVALGQSTARMFFGAFQRLQRERDALVSPALVAVNAGRDGNVLSTWANTSAPWSASLASVAAARLSRNQVQVAWLQVAQTDADRYPDLASRTAAHVDGLGAIARRAQALYPNLRLLLVSAMHSTAYATGSAMPEPYAYQGGFAVRAAIARQQSGAADWNWDPNHGRVVAPLVLWGPYLWATARPRRDGFAWTPDDVAADGTHPSAAGQRKGAEALWDLLAGSPATRPWFLANGAAARGDFRWAFPPPPDRARGTDAGGA
jgi:hypothetical protein